MALASFSLAMGTTCQEKHSSSVRQVVSVIISVYHTSPTSSNEVVCTYSTISKKFMVCHVANNIMQELDNCISVHERDSQGTHPSAVYPVMYGFRTTCRSETLSVCRVLNSSYVRLGLSSCRLSLWKYLLSFYSRRWRIWPTCAPSSGLYNYERYI